MINTLYYKAFTTILLLYSVAASAEEGLTVADLPVEMPVESGTYDLLEPAIAGNMQDEIKHYEQLIAELESRHGAYHSQLGEQFLGLGLALHNQGDYPGAVGVFKRALHINRINQGLNNLDQLPVIDLLIKSNTAMGDWQAVAQNYHYLYWVYRRSYGDNDMRLLDVIYRIGQWHLDAYQAAIDETPFQHLLTAYSLFNQAIRIVETSMGKTSPELVTPLYANVLALYEISHYVTSFYDIEQSGFRSRTYSSTWGYDSTSETAYSMDMMIGDSYRQGKQALTRVIDIYAENPQLPSDGHALAYIYLGDWYLLYNKRTTAMKTYQEAFELMTAMSNEPKDVDLLDKFLAEPRTIPAIRLPTGDSENTSEAKNYVVASFDVLDSGRPVNIEITEAQPPDDIPMRHQAKKSIRASRFRPRFENGQPVATTDVSIRYVFK
jgi:tetratricopeptide (TPR) repeat protein